MFERFLQIQGNIHQLVSFIIWAMNSDHRVEGRDDTETAERQLLLASRFCIFVEMHRAVVKWSCAQRNGQRWLNTNERESNNALALKEAEADLIRGVVCSVDDTLANVVAEILFRRSDDDTDSISTDDHFRAGLPAARDVHDGNTQHLLRGLR